MGYLHQLVSQIHLVVYENRGWMAWNLILAFVPAGLATVLFLPPHRRSLGWWLGVGAFALFLPNAPYVVTDLIHVRADVARASSDGVVVFGVLPLYAAFVAAGYSSYIYCMELIVREVRTVHPRVRRSLVELPVHALCTLGIVLGRVTRLNSWDTITHPRSTVERTFTTLTWRGAPFVYVATFVAVWVTFTVLRTLGRAVWSWGHALVGHASRRRDGRGGDVEVDAVR